MNTEIANNPQNELATTENIQFELPISQDCPKPKTKSKRDIFHFAGDKPTAINLEHVTQIGVEGRKITFQFYSTAIFIELANDDAALSVFKTLLNVWAGDIE